MSERKRFWKDFWQLHVPLALVLALCTFATINQVGRASEGVSRSFVYAIQWPIIGIFAIVVWNRYRKHGSLSVSISQHFKDRTARITREAEEAERVQASERDPDEIAWNQYLTELHVQDPPGGPPSGEKGQ
jgi:hypothetical protein